MGWKDSSVPRRAPISETRPPKTGIELAIINAVMAMPKVQLNQVAQWTKVGVARWTDPRSMRTKRYLLATYFNVSPTSDSAVLGCDSHG